MLLTTIKAFLGGIVNQFVEFWKLQYYLVLTLQEMRKAEMKAPEIARTM